MGVFPAASGNFLPETWRSLMMSPVSVFTSFPRLFTSRSFFFSSSYFKLVFLTQDSSIIDFYPDDFAIDLNGKKYAWQGESRHPVTRCYFVFIVVCKVSFWVQLCKCVYVCVFSEGVALLPFVDERRLRAALADVYPDLTPEEGEQKKKNLSSVKETGFNDELSSRTQYHHCPGWTWTTNPLVPELGPCSLSYTHSTVGTIQI